MASNKFLVFERHDLGKIQKEQVILNESNLIGVDALIFGSVTEFGRSTTGTSGFLSATKVQTARAKVEIRMADARTGYVFFTAPGAGEASTESGQVAGFGSRADYDGTLNDRAIGAAISDVQNALIAKLDERPWRTNILKADGKQLFISGGTRQGLKVGDMLTIMKQGETVKSAQTGFAITLPPTPIGKARISGVFGDNESNEGSIVDLMIVDLISGTTSAGTGSTVFITEANFLSTISRPLAERGYYVFPVHLVKRVMEDDGLSDADMVHASAPQRLGALFGSDAIMYISIERWDAKYVVLSTTVTVELKYALKSTTTGNTLWANSQKLVYQPQNNSNGGLAGLIAQAIVAAMPKAVPNYVPLAQQANQMALYTKGQGLPAGPYDPQYQKDQSDF